MDTPADVVALVDDLMFLSRIREAAQRNGLTVRSVRKVDDLVAAAPRARVVLIDLDTPRLPVAEALSALAALPPPVPRRIGFFSHVETDRARAAEASGCEPIARGAFVRQLDALLTGR